MTRAGSQYELGDVVVAQLFDGRQITGEVTGIEGRVDGVKLRVLSGNLLVLVGAEEILKVVRGGGS